MGEDLDAGFDVLGGGVFVRVMGEAVAAADEEHGDGHGGGEGDAIVTGTADEGFAKAGDGFEGIEEAGGEGGIAGGSRGFLDEVPIEGQVSLIGDGEEAFLEFGGEGVTFVVFGVTEVDGEVGALGDGIGGAGVDGDFADGDDSGGVGAGEGFGAEDAFGRASEGITPEGHGSGAGVVGVAGEVDGEAGLAGDGGDGGSGLVELFEDATLLDVEFDVAERALRRVVDGGGVLVPAFGSEGGGEGDAVDVGGG